MLNDYDLLGEVAAGSADGRYSTLLPASISQEGLDLSQGLEADGNRKSTLELKQSLIRTLMTKRGQL